MEREKRPLRRAAFSFCRKEERTMQSADAQPRGAQHLARPSYPAVAEVLSNPIPAGNLFGFKLMAGRRGRLSRNNLKTQCQPATIVESNAWPALQKPRPSIFKYLPRSMATRGAPRACFVSPWSHGGSQNETRRAHQARNGRPLRDAALCSQPPHRPAVGTHPHPHRGCTPPPPPPSPASVPPTPC